MKSKLLKTLMLTSSMSLVLAACGNDGAEEAETTEEATTEGAAEETAGGTEGRADGHNGEIVVNVAFEGEEISSIEVVEHSETEGMTDEVFTTMLDEIESTGSTDVEYVSGATVSSEALVEAIEDAASTEGVDLQ